MDEIIFTREQVKDILSWGNELNTGESQLTLCDFQGKLITIKAI